MDGTEIIRLPVLELARVFRAVAKRSGLSGGEFRLFLRVKEPDFSGARRFRHSFESGSLAIWTMDFRLRGNGAYGYT